MKLLGIRIEEASGDRVVLTCPVTRDLHQPFGLVHGGVYATLAETAASVAGPAGSATGARWWASPTTPTSCGRRERGLRAEATPLSRGRTTQLWQVEISDDRGRLVATARSGSRTWPRPRRLTVGLAVDRHEHVHGRAGRVVDLEVGRTPGRWGRARRTR